MDVKEAVKVAVSYATDVFIGEAPRVEEVWFDDTEAHWCVTVGLQRSELASTTAILAGKGSATRMHYKTIRINDETGEIVSLRNHEKMPVAPL